MNKRIFALLLALCMLALCSCSRKGEPTEEGFRDEKSGLEYFFVKPMGLYPVEPSEEYLTLKEGKTETVFYEVWFEDPQNFLCYEDSGNFFLVRSEKIKEPTVSEFNPIAASIYGSSNTVFITSFYADNEYLPEDQREHSPTEDSWLCKLIAETLTEGENVSVPVSSENIQDLYYIRLLSQDYPGLYYLVSFFGFNGRYFLRDDAAGKTVYCPRDIILRMVGE
ncbi:MAG: hypothetical protein IJO64_04280 [Clostridia bacterium]|nr:hypothetical protein [Clostridia bacterium]MBQ9848258.1 hypothetical protein [Clostridia bacterium]